MNTKRMRSRYHRSGNGGSRHQNGQASFNRNHVFDSNGPDTRIRGTAQQLHEKYLQHGRDALSSGDRVAAESFFQYAEHYSRILIMMNQSVQQRQQRPQHNNNGYSENTAENTSSSVQEEQPQSESEPQPQLEAVEVIAEEPVEKIVVEETEEAPAEPAPVRPRRGRPARSVAAKKKLQEESN